MPARHGSDASLWIGKVALFGPALSHLSSPLSPPSPLLSQMAKAAAATSAPAAAAAAVKAVAVAAVSSTKKAAEGVNSKLQLVIKSGAWGDLSLS